MSSDPKDARAEGFGAVGGPVSGVIPAQPAKAPHQTMAADPPAMPLAHASLPEPKPLAEPGETAAHPSQNSRADQSATDDPPPFPGPLPEADPVAEPDEVEAREKPHDTPAASPALPRLNDFDSAQLSAIAHLYRGEVYRSTIWRTRLDNTTNWSIVMMGIALTSTFSSTTASALPLLVVGLLLLVFLVFEARRYRYFNIWRARARWLEKNLYAPMLNGSPANPQWREVLAEDYAHPAHHISFFRALGRRLRRNFIWILAIQSVAYWGKLAIHPFPAQDLNDLIGRAAVGPVPGRWVLVAGLIYNGLWLGVALWSWRADLAKHGPDGGTGSMG